MYKLINILYVGVVTRVPCIITMIKDTKEFIVFDGKKLEEGDDLSKLVLEKQNVNVGTFKGIADKPINIEIHGNDLVNLTIIDLPGIVRVKVEGQSNTIVKDVRNMINKYVEGEETIMLVVIPANADIATVEAISIAEKVDPDGCRTIGVMTMVDLAPEKRSVIDVLSQKDVKMKLGIFAVKNRNIEEVKKKLPIKDARLSEKKFFNENYEDYGYYCGSSNLSNVLARILKEKIMIHFPLIVLKLKDNLRKCENQLTQVGEALPEEERQKRSLAIRKVREICDEIKKCLDVESGKSVFDERFHINSNSGKKSENGDSGKKSVVGVIHHHFQKFGDKIRNITIDFNDEYKEKIKGLIKESSSCKVPGFLPYSVFCGEIRKHLDEFEIPTEKVFQSVCTSLENFGREVICSTCAQFQNMKILFSVEFGKLFQSLHERTKRLLDDELVMNGRFLYTNCTKFMNKVNKDKCTYFEGMMGKWLGLGEEIKNKVHDFVSKNTLEQELEEMISRINSLFDIVKTRIMDCIPLKIYFYIIEELRSDTILFNRFVNCVLKSDINDILKESPLLSSKRKILNEEIQKYKKGLETISMMV